MTAEALKEKDASRRGSSPVVFVGIPAFNVEKNIAKVVIHAKEHCSQVVVCDDGSSDETARIAESLGCLVLRHGTNLGYGAAIRTLIDRARSEGADVLVTIDGDGQHNPKEIGSLVEPIIVGTADVVIGTRFGENGIRKDVPKFRKFGIRTITRVVDTLSDSTVTDAQSGFRAYSKRALSTIRPGEQGMGASTEILLMAKDSGLTIVEVPTTVRYSDDSKSTLNPVYHFTDVVAST